MRFEVNEQDNAWKDVIDAYFKECIIYCLPQLSKLINWNVSLFL